MKGIRYTDPAWALLKHLAASEAVVVQCSDPDCLRFHILSGGSLGSIVRNSVVKTLVTAGLLTRSRTLTPTYTVSRKGFREIAREHLKDQFSDSRTSLDVEFSGILDMLV